MYNSILDSNLGIGLRNITPLGTDSYTLKYRDTAVLEWNLCIIMGYATVIAQFYEHYLL